VLQALLASVLTLSLSTGIKTSVDKHKGKGRFDTSMLGNCFLGIGGGDRFLRWGRSVNLAVSSFDWGVMRTKSSIFRPNHFLLKGKVKIGRTFLSIYPVWNVMRKDSCDPPKLGGYAESFPQKRSRLIYILVGAVL